MYFHPPIIAYKGPARSPFATAAEGVNDVGVDVASRGLELAGRLQGSQDYGRVLNSDPYT
jgi:hypothetical protein